MKRFRYAWVIFHNGRQYYNYKYTSKEACWEAIQNIAREKCKKYYPPWKWRRLVKFRDECYPMRIRWQYWPEGKEYRGRQDGAAH